MRDYGKILLSTLIISAGFTAFGGCNRIEDNGELTHTPLPNEAVRIVETDQGFLVTECGQKVLFFQRRPKSLDGKYARADYVHPLYGLDGEVLTEDFPADHRHQRGIFWAWHQLYVGDKKLGDSWSTENFSYDVKNVEVPRANSKSGAIQAEVYWKSPLWADAEGQQRPFVKETTTISIHRARNDIRKIDFKISLLALEQGVSIGGADNKKAYGGFSARIKLPDGLEFTGTNGRVEPKSTPIEAGPWMDFSGRFGNNETITGLAILCHKSNPGYPQRWILRRKGSMQNAVWPGREAVPLSTEKPLTLRYRLIIHRGDAGRVDIDKLQSEYNAEAL